MLCAKINVDLLEKYNVQVPRYTSYPTVPHWQSTPPTEEEWTTQMLETFEATNEKEGISVYLHLPYCEHLCDYCGCFKKISRGHAVEEPYIQALMAEWNIYRSKFGSSPKISQIHLGGGTPTFFSPENLEKILTHIISSGELKEGAELSFEAHPHNTTVQHLKTLYGIGFRRISIGVQDFNTEVQNAIGRVQTYSEVKKLTVNARNIGFTSINYDLIFGLPYQTEQTISKTIEKVCELKPDRIAFYGFAYTPWANPSQRRIDESKLLQGRDKLNLYLSGKSLLEANGYHAVGMDHFALETDSLYQNYQTHRLHRNFMGYTDQPSKLMVGLGASSISDSWGAFAQNEKRIAVYMEMVNEGKLPIIRGHVLSKEDKVIRTHILELLCKDKTVIPQEWLIDVTEKLADCISDNLVTVEGCEISVKMRGKQFIRNICAALDPYFNQHTKEKMFSKAV